MPFCALSEAKGMVINMKYHLTTVSYNEKAKTDIYNQLTSLIGDSFQITSYRYDDYLRTDQPQDGLILLTAPVIKDLVISHLNSNCKYIIAKRTINPRNIRLLFDIPENAEVLVVSNLYQNALDVISELKCIGINHLRLFAHNPNQPIYREYQYAITLDEIDLVPQSIPNIINIGPRLISLMTIAQIIFYCTGAPMADDFLYARYIKDLVSVSMGLANQIKQNNLLQEQMNMVISNFEDGVLMTDAGRKITFYNTMATSILGEEKLIGKYLDEVNIPFGNNEDTTFINIMDKVIHVSRKEVTLTDNKKIQMITLKDLTNIKKIDEQYKRRKKYTESNAKYTFHDVVHKSATMSKLIDIAKQLAIRSSTILITGESGTGKELIAQSIHNASDRSKFPFIAINCAALPEALLESELFGYEGGAFTGARKEGKLGLFELACNGTIFLDEIGDAPQMIQTKLLRVLQEKEIMRVAGNSVIPINVRVIAATNKDLPQMIEQGLFRQDLYYRLKVLSLYIPPLRERNDDIEILTYYFLHKHGAKKPSIDKELMDFFRSYSWPGNIRELENIAEYIATISPGSKNLKEDIIHVMLHELKGNLTRQGINSSPGNLIFRNPEMRKELTDILQILYEAKFAQLSIGRYKIQEILKNREITLSCQQVKTRLDILRNSGLIISYNGKGSVITDKGVEYLYSPLP